MINIVSADGQDINRHCEDQINVHETITNVRDQHLNLQMVMDWLAVSLVPYGAMTSTDKEEIHMHETWSTMSIRVNVDNETLTKE